MDEAERLVADVERVLGRPRGLRIGEAAETDTRAACAMQFELSVSSVVLFENRFNDSTLQRQRSYSCPLVVKRLRARTKHARGEGNLRIRS